MTANAIDSDNQGIAELGHVGIWVDSIDRMADFYARTLGLSVTDRDDGRGLVFLSSRPDHEHHEILLVRRRGDRAVQGSPEQLSWRVHTLDGLLVLLKRLQNEPDVRIQQIVTHGIALGVYFFDPEGNRSEVYWNTGINTAQPFRQPINLEQSEESILKELNEILDDAGIRFTGDVAGSSPTTPDKST